jgi:hypothetical protein
MKHEVRPNSSYSAVAILLGVSVDAIVKFLPDMHAYDLGQKILAKRLESAKTSKKPNENA